jgi:8-oxo-dGTP pyrophosphatase MutT (NUDIX family)
MRWQVHGERELYASPWVRLALADVELPDGQRFEHHVVRATADAVALVVHDPVRGVLLLWRHRFTTDTWGWEVPAGRVDPGERPRETAVRETIEETGWRPTPPRFVAAFHPTNGSSDHRFHVYAADGAERVGDPDPNEASRVAWLPPAEVARAIAGGEVPDGLSLTALLLVVPGVGPAAEAAQAPPV